MSTQTIALSSACLHQSEYYRDFDTDSCFYFGIDFSLPQQVETNSLTIVMAVFRDVQNLTSEWIQQNAIHEDPAVCKKAYDYIVDYEIGVVSVPLLSYNNIYAQSHLTEVKVVVDNLPYKVNGENVCKDMPLAYYADSLQSKDIRKQVCLRADGYRQRIILVRTIYARKGYLMVNQLVYQRLLDTKTENQPHSYLYYIDGVLVTNDNLQNLIRLKCSKIRDVAIEQDDQTNGVTVMITTKDLI